MMGDPLSEEMRRRVETAARLFPIDGPSVADGLPKLGPIEAQVYCLYESGLLVDEISNKVGCDAPQAIARIRAKGYPLTYRVVPPEHRRRMK